MKQQLLDDEPVIYCRYCFSDDNVSDMVSPCRCKGSVKYVHKKCLKEWFAKKNYKMVLPGSFRQFDHSCEICHTKYKLSFKKIIPKSTLYKDLFLYIFTVTIILLSTYIGIGLILEQSENTENLFTEWGNHLENIICNGFIMTHIILGIFYMIMGLIFVFENCRCRNFFCIFESDNEVDDCNDSDCNILICCRTSNNDSNNCDGHFICVLFLVIIGVLVTIFLIYCDIVSRVIQRHKNQSLIIFDVKPYVNRKVSK